MRVWAGESAPSDSNKDLRLRHFDVNDAPDKMGRGRLNLVGPRESGEKRPPPSVRGWGYGVPNELHKSTNEFINPRFVGVPPTRRLLGLQQVNDRTDIGPYLHDASPPS